MALTALAIISLLFNVVTSFPTPSTNAPALASVAEASECNIKNLQRIIFNSTLTDFYTLFTSPTRPTCYHWCTNACSWSPDSFPYNTKGDKTSWKPACARHDFAWHNLKMLGAFDEDSKLRADEGLRDGMVELCGEHKVCREVSRNVYFTAVRNVAEPAVEHSEWDPSKKVDCTVFPGCCENHGDSRKCGPEPLPGQFKGDGSCVAR